MSADEHLVEPAEFWDDWLPAHLPPEMRDRAPRLEGVAVVLDGEPLRTFGLFPDLVRRSDEATGASDVAARCAVLDSAGVDAAIVYPQRAMSMWGLRDPLLVEACFDAYNEWLATQCAESGGRLHGVPVLATVHRPEATADALQRIRELGFHTFMLPNHPRGVRYGEASMATFWSAIEDAGLPVSFHISEAPDGNGPGELGAYLAVSFQPFRKLWSYLVFSGVLERHPGLRLVFAEGGISWVPSALDHADHIRRHFSDHLTPRLGKDPSEHWHTQCWATFMHDPCGLEQLGHIGADRVMWASDYPHPEGTAPDTRGSLRELRDRLGPTGFTDVAGATAARVYALPQGRASAPV